MPLTDPRSTPSSPASGAGVPSQARRRQAIRFLLVLVVAAIVVVQARADPGPSTGGSPSTSATASDDRPVGRSTPMPTPSAGTDDRVADGSLPPEFEEHGDRPATPDPSRTARATGAPDATGDAGGSTAGGSSGTRRPRPSSAAPTPTPVPPRPVAAGPIAGVWINADELARLPTSGRAWDSVVAAAQRADRSGNVGDQDSDHDQWTLAAAIVAARTGSGRDRAIAALESAIGTETNDRGRWLAVGRNLTSYVIAADLLGIRSGPIHDWLASFRTKRLSHNNDEGNLITFRESAWSSGSNASAQEGAAYTALAVYLGDGEMLAWSWNAFRRYAGDRSSSHRLRSNSDAWQERPNDPVGIQNAGARIDGCSVDGAISNDMSRGGSDVCDPGYTQYPWVGLEGAVPAAVILSRAGYPAFDVADRALRRAAVYLMRLRNETGESEWYDADRAPDIKHLLNRVYGLGYPTRYPTGPGRTIGFTDYTHP